MDVGTKKDVPNPRENASQLSKILFLWIYPLFCKGAKQDLNIDDLYNPLNEDRSSHLGIRLSK